ncbi:ATP-binding protein [Vibrio mediterranei]|nr:ATP-binding protein [Vibrio mediterranei]
MNNTNNVDNNFNDEDNFVPSPGRLVEGLRDTGYSIEAAFADIVDNSIAAKATKVWIKIYLDVIGDLRVLISDNGEGMDLTTLLNAMRYGSPKRESPNSLGKFGMGLKTASTAFCKRLTVLSKHNDSTNLRTWDIDEIVRLDRWALLTPEIEDYEEDAEILDTQKSGTVVIWENVDRLVGESRQKNKKEAVTKLSHEIEQHLSAVFGKFLGSQCDETETVDIYINDKAISGWDPTGMWLNSPKKPKRVIKVSDILKSDSEVKKSDGETASFELNGYIIPNRSELTTDELDKIRYGTENQGFYIYRENRLIFGGGWPHRMFSKEPHLNLLRIELNFEHDLDDYFQIDIRKTRVIIPPEKRKQIKKRIGTLRNEANRRYRSAKTKDGGNKGDQADRHDNSQRAINKQREHNKHATIDITDSEAGLVSVQNKFGLTEEFRTKLVEDTDVSVQVQDSLDDGTLWTHGVDENGEICVIFNKSHPFYQKFYDREENNPVLIQSMDSVFWALANAEISSFSQIAKRNIEEYRFNVSKDLRNLSDELPDVD